MSRGLNYVDDGDIQIKPTSFDPQTTEVQMTVKTAGTETAPWGPSERDDPLWIQDEGLFRKVHFNKCSDEFIRSSVILRHHFQMHTFLRDKCFVKRAHYH